MGCGSSKTAAERARVTLALSSHVSAILGLQQIHPEIQQYVSALNSEGYNTPDDFEDLTVDELREEPFCFKAGHLKKVTRSRKKSNDVAGAATGAGGAAAAAAAVPSPEPAGPNSLTTIRGQCSLCGRDVLDTQPRIKDQETGVYEHQDCGTARRPSIALFPGSPAAEPETKGLLPETKGLLPETKGLLPDGKHAFLSYQWDVQEQVKEIKRMLTDRQIKCWMDIDGGMKSDIYDSMAEGVQGAACVVCFMTQAYQDSANCKLELKFAQQSGVPIIPVMMQTNFTAKGWLGILTSGSIWTPMYEKSSVVAGVENLITQAQHVVPGMRGGDGDTFSDMSSEAGSSFDVAKWGDDMFSYDEMRDELERLREDTLPSAGATKRATGVGVGVGGALICPLPAMVPTLPRGVFVTAEMQSVLDAVLSVKSTPQTGFCGMGGIGKTTVSCWVTRSEEVRTKFGTVAWVSLGQTPVLDSCIDLLHMQLTGSSLPSGLSGDQKNEHLKQAFLSQSVLLVLDDCWDADVAKHFTWIDPSTNSKVLISSRVRDVLEGGDVIDVSTPSLSDAVKMLLSTAGMELEALHNRDEVAHVAKLCKRLPLTIGVAGKLIRQLMQGSSTSEASDWADVVALLEDELKDPEGSLSVEEGVIRASIKAIPKKIRKQVTQLFYGFSLVPEDRQCPLPVIGMIFHACSDPNGNGNGKSAKPLSRLLVRRYLKVLIDRSLVLGTVDRPQLHDVMLDYVQKQLAGDAYKAAQRRLVDAFRKSDRSTSTPTGKYLHQCVRHHIKESHDLTWGESPQALSWLEDHVSGVQDVVATSVATILPAERLAKEAEAAEMWWRAALYWNAFGLMKKNELGSHFAGNPYFKLAVAASAKANVALNSIGSTDGGATQYELDSFDLHAINFLFKAWNPADLVEYGPRMRDVVGTKAGISRPAMVYSAAMSLDWLPAMMSGNEQTIAGESWKLSKMILDLSDETTEVYTLSTEEDKAKGKPLMAYILMMAGDAVQKSPGFSWDLFGKDGAKFIEHYNAYNYEDHHDWITDLVSVDVHIAYPGNEWLLTLQFGRVADARRMVEENVKLAKKAMTFPASAGYTLHVTIPGHMVTRLHYILGLPQCAQKLYDAAGLTFDAVEERYDTLTKPMQGSFFTTMDQNVPAGCFYSLKRMVWQAKALYILNMDVPKSKAIAWLESLPDNEAVYACSVTFPTFDYGALFGMHQFNWLALAHEKVGLYEGALRFADLQMEPDYLKGGAPLLKWPQVSALACKGRVLAKLKKHDEALIAFQAAISTSKESYSLMELFAYRELANYADGGEAAVQALVDLEAKLKTFEGRLTREEFDALRL